MMKTLLLLATLLAAAPAAAAGTTVTIAFDSLPSAQGWTYVPGGNDVGHAESSAFSLGDGVLQQDTLGFGLHGYGSNLYTYDLDVAPGAVSQMSVTALVQSYEANVYQSGAAYPYGFSFGFVANGYEYYVGVASSRIGYVRPDGQTSYADFPLGFQAGQFNTYTLTANGGLLSLAINGTTVLNDVAALQLDAPDMLYLGDGTGGANARAQVSALSFTSPVPEPSTWMMMGAGLGLAGVAARRRRTA